MTGRKRNIYLWDIKVLSCLSLSIQLVAKSFQIQIPATTHDCIDTLIDPLLQPGIEYYKVKEFATWCLKIKGKEHTMFNTSVLERKSSSFDDRGAMLRRVAPRCAPVCSQKCISNLSWDIFLIISLFALKKLSNSSFLQYLSEIIISFGNNLLMRS